MLGSPRARRPYWRSLHLWLGLILGLPMAIFGLTGSVLVFWQEIDSALNPGLYELARVPAERTLRLEESIAAAQALAPPGWESSWISVAPEADKALTFHFYYPPEKAHQAGAESFNVFVDPYTAQALATRVFYHPSNPLQHCFVGFFFKLHYALLLKEPGMLIVGVMALLLLLSTLAGLILWWPLDGNWYRALTVKRRSGAVRLNHDLHQTHGFYSLPVILAVLLSGVSFNLPEQFKALVGAFSPLTPEAVATGKPDSGPPAGGLDAFVAAVARRPAAGTLNNLVLVSPTADAISVCFRGVGELSAYVVDTRCLLIDRQSGDVLQTIDPSRGSAGDVFMQWQWPLHSGQLFGWTGRILVFLSGLACPVLFVTGFIRWMQKRRARRVSAARRGIRPQEV